MKEGGSVALEEVRRVAVFPHGDLLFSFFLADAVALLNLAEQLFALSGDHVQVVVGELAPLLFDLAFELAPIAFHAVVIQSVLLKKKGNLPSGRKHDACGKGT